jgi:hypothetical protein
MGGRPFQPIMVPPNASISMGTKKTRQGEEIKHKEHNDNFIFTGDANLRHTPKYWVRIFNVSGLEQRIERPWVMPGHAGKVIVIPAADDGEETGNPFVIPDIVQMPVDRAGSWELGTRGVDGRFLAQDAINPEEPSGNWRTVRTRLESMSANEGTNLYHWGCFWDVTKGLDLDQEADQEAVKTAIERMEANYNRLIDEANMLALGDKDQIRQIGATHRRAANYFGLSFTWNIRHERKASCPNCGRDLPKTASRCFHDGCKFVINWERALAQGMASKEEAIAAGIIAKQAEAMASKKESAGRKKTSE